MRWLTSTPTRRQVAAVRWLAVATCLGMFLVLVMGVEVTNTGSNMGCGRSWPLCNGQLVPEFTVATAIEYSHRAVTGVETFLVLGLSAALLAFWRRRREVRVLVPLMLGTLFLQAGLGAWAVLYPQVPAVMATHFGVSLVAFASTFLAATFVWELGPAERLRNAPLPATTYRRAVLGVMAYVLLIVVYLGAYVRHAGASLGCVDWPLCNGQLVPPLEGTQGIVFVHRLAALIAVLLLGWLATYTWRVRSARPDLAAGAAGAFALVVLQALVGAAVVLSRLSLFSLLAHAAIMALLAAALTYLYFHTLPVTAPAEAESPLPTGAARPAYSH